MRTFLMLSLALLGATVLQGAQPLNSSATEEAAKFEGIWHGHWNAFATKIEFSLKRTEGLKFDVVYRAQDTRSDQPPKTYQGKAEYDPQLKRLKYLAIEFSWHDDGKRLVAKGTFDALTSYALLKRKPGEEAESPSKD